MTGMGALVRKDARLAAGVVLPSVSVLALGLVAWVAAPELGEAHRALGSSGVAIPPVSHRIGHIAAALCLAFAALPCGAAVIMAQGDRTRGAQAVQAVAPRSDAAKAASKVVVLAACIAVSVGAVATVVTRGAVSFDGWQWPGVGLPVVQSPFAMAAVVACVGGVVGLAAGLVAPRPSLAWFLAMVTPLAVAACASLAAHAWFRTPWGPSSVSPLPEASEWIWNLLRWERQAEASRAFQRASALGSVLGTVVAAGGVLVSRWRGLAGRSTGSHPTAMAATMLAVMTAIAVSIGFSSAAGGLPAMATKAREAFAACQRVEAMSDLEIATAYVGQPGFDLPGWSEAEQTARLRRIGRLMQPNNFDVVTTRVRSALGLAGRNAEFSLGCARRVMDERRARGLASECMDADWTQAQRLHLLEGAPSHGGQLRCEVLAELATTQDPDHRDFLTGWFLWAAGRLGVGDPNGTLGATVQGEAIEQTPMARVRALAMDELERDLGPWGPERLENCRELESKALDALRALDEGAATGLGDRRGQAPNEVGEHRGDETGGAR